MSGTVFVVENGLLKQKLFVGPLLPLVTDKRVKSSLSKVLEGYEVVTEQQEITANIKEQQIAIAKAEVAGFANIEKMKPKVIRRRRKFVYHAADEVINKGYWKREKRSLTKLHSNSLMFEYSVLK